MRHTYAAGDVEFFVDALATGAPRSFSWSFSVPLLDLRGESKTPVRGLSAAFRAGESAARLAIEIALEG